MMKKLPIGLQSFENLLLDNSIYVDKTEYIYQLLTSGGRTFFLSRPRRFGKSLLLSTIKAIFEGKRELFKGLFIEDKIDWEPRPVLMLDMGKDSASSEILKRGIKKMLASIATMQNVEVTEDEESPAIMLEELISNIYLKTGKQIVVLVDEYDKPILDNVDDLALAAEQRKTLQSFYSVLKSSSDKIRFLMLTGVSKVSQTSIFSGLNNLNDITLDLKFAAICGYTQQELESKFSEYIYKLAKSFDYSIEDTLKQIKHWYNGYSWDGAHFVYNPFSVLLLFSKDLFLPFWYHTGTPTFLLKLLKKEDSLETILQEKISVRLTFTQGQALEDIDPVALLFQTGYLTIKSFDRIKQRYQLEMPNEEVRKALSESIIVDLSGKPNTNVNDLADHVKESFSTGNTAFAIENLDILLANISYNANEPNKNESHYHALFQLTMNMAGIDHRAESANNLGRADSVLKFSDRVYVVEIKYAASSDDFPSALIKAMEQIKNNGYHKPYLNQGKQVHLLALAFTKGGIAFEEALV